MVCAEPYSIRCSMTAITIPLSDEKLERLRAMADQAGISAEDLARAGLEEWLSRPRTDFVAAAEYVFRKNAELYRRLA
jgi:antitoxin FitA